jgi:CRISPR/Cas system-associated exonuclease Cas4 (RecB family)
MSKVSWSFSRLMVYEQCPYRFKLQFIDRVPDEQPKTAADRGTAIHQEAEDYVTGKGEFTGNLRHFKPDFLALKTHYDAGRVTVEEEWAFDRDWKVAEWRTGWLRLKCDAVLHLNKQHVAVIDHKTGKRFGNEIKHARQLQLYALTSLLRYEAVDQVTCELWYLDQNELSSFVMHRKQLGKYLKMFDREGRAVTEAKTYPPRPNIESCKYCPYHADRQGNCEHGVSVLANSGKIIRPTPKPLEQRVLSENEKRRTAALLGRL